MRALPMIGRRHGRSAPLPAALGSALSMILAAAAVTAIGAPSAHATHPERARGDLYLVTLAGGSGVPSGLDPDTVRQRRLARQDKVLAAVEAPPPLYRWTTALNGFAVRLDADQARAVAEVAGVVTVEPNAVRRLAGIGRPLTTAPARRAAGGGGAGVVIGVVDSGIDPDSPVFASVPGLGRGTPDFSGDCVAGEGWSSEQCSSKIVGARWYVAGYGSDRLSGSSVLSARDDSGHGTLVASVAAGNAGVSVRVGREDLGTHSGTAPQARLSVYKACWTAPDPADDGCATADLVSAIDRATADGVDVLNLSLAGGDDAVDTIERALLGATESGVFVAAAAGNQGSRYAGHANPWVTTVGATTVPSPGGVLSARGDGSVSGAMSSRRRVTAPLLVAADAAAPSTPVDDARLCLPGSLDAAAVEGRIVLCDRGGIGRVDKSQTVRLADGVGMVLANGREHDLHADFHEVPTLHVTRGDAATLRTWATTRPARAVTLAPGADVGGRAVAAWSPPGDSRADLVKPDLADTGVDVLGAAPRGDSGAWDLFSGTSAATARVSGRAAQVLGRHPEWSPARVRSALMTTAQPVTVTESALRQGAGRPRATAALSPRLVYDLDVRDYRRWLHGGLDGDALNLPSIKVDHAGSVRRTVTYVGARPHYFSVRVHGLSRHQVRVSPVAIRVSPGESASYTVTISGRVTRRADSGWLTWRGADGTRVRIPVVISD